MEEELKEKLLHYLWLLIAAVLGTVSTFQITFVLLGANTNQGDGAFIATTLTLVVAVVLVGISEKEVLEVFFTGAFAGMSTWGGLHPGTGLTTSIVIPTIWWSWLAGVFVWIIWVLVDLIGQKKNIDKWLHDGGKHGTIAFIAMLIFALINLGTNPALGLTGIYPIGAFGTGPVYLTATQLLLGAFITVPAGALFTLWVRKNVEMAKNKITAFAIAGLIGTVALNLLAGWFFGFDANYGGGLGVSTIILAVSDFGPLFLTGCFIGLSSNKKIESYNGMAITGIIGGGLLMAFYPLIPFGGFPGFIALISIIIYRDVMEPIVIPKTEQLIDKTMEKVKELTHKTKEKKPAKPREEKLEPKEEKPAKKATKKSTKKKSTKKTTKKTAEKTAED